MNPTHSIKGHLGNPETMQSDNTSIPLPLIRDTRLKDKDVRVWVFIKNQLSANLCDFSAERIGKAIGCKSTAVENAIKRLIATGWLARQKRPKSKLYDYATSYPESARQTANERQTPKAPPTFTHNHQSAPEPQEGKDS